MTKILIAIDDSRFSDLVLESVKLRTWHPKTDFYVCSIVSNEGLQYLPQKHVSAAQAALMKQVKFTEAFLAKKVDDLRRALGTKRVYPVLEIGNVAESIVSLAEEFSVDLIMVGSHGWRGVSRYALGSVAQAVVNVAMCSVEIVRNSQSYSDFNPDPAKPGFLMQNRILICYDRSPYSRAALEWVARSQWSPQQQFVVLMVLAPLEDQVVKAGMWNRRMIEKAKDSVLQESEQILTQVNLKLRKNPNIRTIATEVCEGYAAETIIQFAESWMADAIIIGAHTASAQVDPSNGSVASRIAGYANCSVMIVRSDPGESWREHQQVFLEVAR